MKILYIGHYKEGSGWSNAAINNILALDSIGLDVVCRNVKLTPYHASLPDRIIELEKKDINNVDYCIQHVLPHHLVGTQKFKKNIAYFVGESTTIKYTPWAVNLKLMDEVWVPSKYCKNVLLDTIPENKIKIIPHCFDLTKYTQQYPKFNFTNHQDYFKFYYIGEINDRKNLDCVIRSFHSEFGQNEPVMLILKIKKYGIQPDQLFKQTNEYIKNIKTLLRIYPNISREVIITNEMDNSMIMALHQSCDCFVNPSHGEGWSIPAFDAMCFGNTPICSNEGGPSEFISNENTGTLVSGTYQVCNHHDPAFPDIFTGKEEWFIPNEIEVKKAMRFYFENRNKYFRQKAGLEQAQKFNYTNIANMIKDALNA